MIFCRGRFLPLLITCLLSLAAQAQQHTPLTLAEAEDLALDQEPGYEALQQRSQALAEQAVAEGQLPDPTLRVGIANYPIQSGGFSTEGMTQAQLGYRQSFPSGDSREFRTLKFESLSLEMSESAGARRRDVLSQVRSDWLDAYYWQHARAMVLEKRPFFADLVAVRGLAARTIEAYRDSLESEGVKRTVDFVRVGRVGLYYQSLDGARAGAGG